ncbi:MAG: CZB domain-containing protein [Sulfuricella sp.]|nr:CZB domain-containing protein [Sulfuricella sp.]
MSILDWLKRATSGEQLLQDGGGQPQATFAKGEEEFHGLNMREAIDAHIRWKTRLQDMLEGNSDEQLEVGVVAADDKCTLGKWLHHEAAKFGNLEEFRELVSIHAEFHLTAGNILAECHRGEKEAGLYMLHSRDFRFCSDKVQLALVRLYAKVRS